MRSVRRRTYPFSGYLEAFKASGSNLNAASDGDSSTGKARRRRNSGESDQAVMARGRRLPEVSGMR